MSNITLSAVTKAMETLESIVRAEKDYITIAEMLDIAHIAQAGALGIYKCLCFTLFTQRALSHSCIWRVIDGGIPADV